MNPRKNPKTVAVVIPFYNREICLGWAIESVMNQNYKDFTLYLVDDASTDKSLEVAQSYQSKWPDQIEIEVLPENKGVSFARNLILKNVDSDYYALLDSDDEWLSSKLEQQMNSLAESKLLVSHTEEIWIRKGVRVNQMKKHQKFGGQIFEHCLDMCKMSPSSILIQKTVFDQIGYFNDDYLVCEDYDLWLRLSCRFEVDFVSTPLINKYGGHDDQLSRQHHSMDFWRLRSLASLVSDGHLTDEYRQLVLAAAHKKYRILEKGYKKHGTAAALTELAELYQIIEDNCRA